MSLALFQQHWVGPANGDGNWIEPGTVEWFPDGRAIFDIPSGQTWELEGICYAFSFVYHVPEAANQAALFHLTVSRQEGNSMFDRHIWTKNAGEQQDSGGSVQTNAAGLVTSGVVAGTQWRQFYTDPQHHKITGPAHVEHWAVNMSAYRVFCYHSATWTRIR